MRETFKEMESGMIFDINKINYIDDDLKPYDDLRLGIRKGEEWRQVKGTASYYVSNHGRVATVERYAIMDKQMRKYKAKILKQSINNSGYLQLNLSEGMGLQLVHRLVFEAFNGKIEDGKEIDHKNNNKLDNRIENLQQLTHKANVRKRFAQN